MKLGEISAGAGSGPARACCLMFSSPRLNLRFSPETWWTHVRGHSGHFSPPPSCLRVSEHLPIISPDYTLDGAGVRFIQRQQH
jgi:hypothetical protein